jgi:coenzyme F420-reducing hydrogenase gamma subunit
MAVTGCSGCTYVETETKDLRSEVPERFITELAYFTNEQDSNTASTTNILMIDGSTAAIEMERSGMGELLKPLECCEDDQLCDGKSVRLWGIFAA